ncbi:hypothetical protein FB390_0862 [Nocardia bhagyanarayanae]|uniref:Uncharacterized protein n=1 Tax=Nocardia bhagyanarayanae TaxID=1215925 RepID=A0A543F607_9NOCA|nr:hypothetical protein FB390_0862 [Nocardia bhagyanarayanae]
MESLRSMIGATMETVVVWILAAVLYWWGLL